MIDIAKADAQPIYKRGFETQDRIFQCAKRLFHEIGYKKATIEKIARQADVPVGLVTYYFKKDSILSRIYSDYLNAAVKCIEDQVGDQIENHLQKHLLLNQVFFSRLVEDAASMEIYKEVFLRRLIPESVHRLIQNNMRMITVEFDLGVTDEIFEKLVMAEMGARRELLFYSYEILKTPRDKHFYYFLGSVTSLLAGLSADIIRQNVEYVDRLLPMIDTSGLVFLV